MLHRLNSPQSIVSVIMRSTLLFRSADSVSVLLFSSATVNAAECLAVMLILSASLLA